MGYKFSNPSKQIRHNNPTTRRRRLLHLIKSPPRMLPTPTPQIRNPNQLLHPRPQQRPLRQTRQRKIRNRKNRDRRERTPNPNPPNPNGTPPKSHPQRTNVSIKQSHRHREPTNQKRNQRHPGKKISTKSPTKKYIRSTKSQNKNNLRNSRQSPKTRKHPHEIFPPRRIQRRKTRIIRPNTPPIKQRKNLPKTTNPLRRHPHDPKNPRRRTQRTPTRTRTSRRNPRTIIFLKHPKTSN